MNIGRLLAKWMVCIVLFRGMAEAMPVPPGPEPRYVHDDARWLGADAFSSLDLKLDWFERRTSARVIVAIFPRLPDGEESARYSQRVFEAWLPEKKDQANGVILMFFEGDPDPVIQSGERWRNVLSEERFVRIVRDAIAPKLETGDREGAVDAGVKEVLKKIEEQHTTNGITPLEPTVRGRGARLAIFLVLLGSSVALVLFRSAKKKRA